MPRIKKNQNTSDKSHMTQLLFHTYVFKIEITIPVLKSPQVTGTFSMSRPMLTNESRIRPATWSIFSYPMNLEALMLPSRYADKYIVFIYTSTQGMCVLFLCKALFLLSQSSDRFLYKYEVFLFG